MNSPKLTYSPKLTLSPRLSQLRKYHISDKLQKFDFQSKVRLLLCLHYFIVFSDAIWCLKALDMPNI